MNLKTTLTGVGAAFMSALTMLAAVPYTIGDTASVIPPEWKGPLIKIGLISALLLQVLNAYFQKDKDQPKP